MSYKNNKKFDRKKSFQKSNEKITLTWIYREGKWPFWFIDTKDKNWYENSYYVFFTNRWNALAWDEVNFNLKEFKWRNEAVVKNVIKRSNSVLTWIFKPCKDFCPNWQKWYGFVILDNPYIKNDVFIAWKDLQKLEEWDKVALKIIKWTGKNPEWKIIEKIWKTWEKYVDLMTMAYEWWAHPKFPDKLIESLKNISNKINEDDIKKRKDLRELFTYTIDPDDAKDFDDAISIEKLDNWNYKLWVHIADVTNYIPENSELDKEAKLRGTSIYFVDRVIPMLPEILSNNLCSLNPFEDKFCMTCEMEVESSWNVIKTDVYESVIKSNFRMSYRIVDDIKNMWFKDWDMENLIIKHDSYTQDDLNLLFEKLKLSFELKDILYNHKKNNAYIEFDIIETKIIVDENGFPIEIKEYPKYEANRVIEFFMILANEEVSKKYSKIPFLYRVHPAPEEEDIERLKFALKSIWIKYSDKITDIIEKIKWNPAESYISKIILRSMQKAVYSDINDWHYGLGLEYYSHFTSPIRRYPDLQIHRIIKEKLHNKLDLKRILHYKNILPQIATLSSENEQKAEDIEHKIDDYLKAKFMIDKIWLEFDWTVSWLIERWFFVQLENTVEWFVDIIWDFKKNNPKFLWKTKQKLKLDYDDLLLEITNHNTWERFRLWDKVRIKVIAVDEVFSRVDFDLVKKIN